MILKMELDWNSSFQWETEGNCDSLVDILYGHIADSRVRLSVGDADVESGPKTGLVVARERMSCVRGLKLGGGQVPVFKYTGRSSGCDRNLVGAASHLPGSAIVVSVPCPVESSLVGTQLTRVLDDQRVRIGGGQLFTRGDHEEVVGCVQVERSHGDSDVGCVGPVQAHGVHVQVERMDGDGLCILRHSQQDADFSGKVKVRDVHAGVQVHFVADGVGVVGQPVGDRILATAKVIVELNGRKRFRNGNGHKGQGHKRDEPQHVAGAATRLGGELEVIAARFRHVPSNIGIVQSFNCCLNQAISTNTGQVSPGTCQ